MVNLLRLILNFLTLSLLRLMFDVRYFRKIKIILINILICLYFCNYHVIVIYSPDADYYYTRGDLMMTTTTTIIIITLVEEKKKEKRKKKKTPSYKIKLGRAALVLYNAIHRKECYCR